MKYYKSEEDIILKKAELEIMRSTLNAALRRINEVLGYPMPETNKEKRRRRRAQGALKTKR